MPSGRHFVEGCWLAITQYPQLRHCAGTLEVVYHEWKSLVREERRPIHDLEMEMWIRRIAAVPELGEYLSPMYSVPCFDLDASGLKMCVKCKPAVPQIEDDVISSCVYSRHPRRHGSRYLFGRTVFNADNSAIGDRVHGNRVVCVT